MRRSKLFWLSLAVLLFSFSALSYAEVCFTDSEYQELTEIFSELETINGQQQTRIKTLETATKTSETALKKSEAARATSEKETAAAQTSLLEVKNSLAEERKAARIKLFLTAGGSLSVGLIVGFICGGCAR